MSTLGILKKNYYQKEMESFKNQLVFQRSHKVRPKYESVETPKKREIKPEEK